MSIVISIYQLSTFVHWLLFIHKILISSTCFEPQVLIFRRIQLYTCSIWYCHYLWEFVVVCRYTAQDYYFFIKYYSPLHVSSLKCSSSGGYSCIHAAYGTVSLYESSWWPVGTQLQWELIESDSTICCMYTTVSSWRWALEARNMYRRIIFLWINNNQRIKLVINI